MNAKLRTNNYTEMFEMKRETNTIRVGFTLVELLTTLAVIGILLGLLIPALNQVSKFAANVKQKAQFHAIGMALEAFRNDWGDYPPSEWDPATYGDYSASQRLAEAIIGRDGFGFHPSSRFREDGTDGTKPLYAPAVDLSLDPDNLKSRKGPYLELESANAVDLAKLYGGAVPGNYLVSSYVLVDMYKIQNAFTGKTTGTPILYYKANRLKTAHDAAKASPDSATNQCTYNVYDSLGNLTSGIASLQPLTKAKAKHDMFTSGGVLFYDKTLNPNFPGDRLTKVGARPYRADSFLLHSAGPDGLYGTADDVFNFDQDN